MHTLALLLHVRLIFLLKKKKPHSNHNFLVIYINSHLGSFIHFEFIYRPYTL